MDFFDSNYFTYKNNILFCEEIPVEEIVNTVGTPAFIYSKKFFTDRFNEFTAAFSKINHTIFYAVKSNFNINVIKTFYDLGCGIDVNSAGEFYRAVKAGVDPAKMILTGVGKTEEEIKLGIENNVKFIKAESEQEIYLIDKIAGELGKIAPVAIRVNPDVDPKTHPYISTGLAENKFGIDSKTAYGLFLKASKLKNIKLTGIDMHIGSQITSVKPFREAVEKLAEMFHQLKSDGVKLTHFDIGGGMGVKYKDETPFTPDELAETLLPILSGLNCEVSFEPGRYLTANGGILVTEVLYTKSNQHKNFIVVDAAMTDLLRPSIYGAYHHIQPVKINNRKDIIADIVGPVCESGDFLAKKRTITECKPKEKLAVFSTGAYSMVMASNYNGRRRAPEIIVNKNKFFIVRGRETFEHLLFDEEIKTDLFD